MGGKVRAKLPPKELSRIAPSSGTKARCISGEFPYLLFFLDRSLARNPSFQHSQIRIIRTRGKF